MKNYNQDNRLYETEKLTFAAYLLASGKSELKEARPVLRSNIVLFVLSPPPSNEDITNFFNGTGQVSALKFSETMNTLKSAAYEIRRNSNSSRNISQ